MVLLRIMVNETDPRKIARDFFPPDSMVFTRGGYERYAISTPEYAYGIHASYGEFDKVNLWVPRNLVVVQQRLLLRDGYKIPDLSDQDLDVYIWLHIGVGMSNARRSTYVGKDLLEFNKSDGGFQIELSSALPIEFAKMRHGESFNWAVLNRRPQG